MEFLITASEAKIATERLPETATPGCDGIEPMLLKLGINSLKKTFAKIFNKSYLDNYLPYDWRFPVLYKVPRGIPGNYRPICLNLKFVS